MNTTRAYRMGARAEGVRETRARIIAAVIEEFLESNYSEITLQRIGERSDVSVQTIIRHFGGKDRMFAEAFEQFSDEIKSEMDAVQVGDVRGAIEALHSRYEWMGDSNVRMLAQEESVEPVAEVMRIARQGHREWVERVFDPYLPKGPASERRKRLFQFLIVCDVYTWKLVRRDHGGSRAATTQAVVELATSLIDTGRTV